MATTVFTIANQKGGVGKTTTAINLCVALARRKVETLLIDLDPQANATSGIGLDKVEGSSLYDVLHGDGTALDKVQPTSEKNLSIIPSEKDMAALEIELGRRENYLSQLREALQPVIDSGQFRCIIIDCPPSLGMISMNALAVADYLLIALQCEYLAMEGLSEICAHVDQLREAGVNERLSVGGIIMTMYDMRTNLSRQVVGEVSEYFPDKVFKSLIPRSIRLSEAPSFGQSIFEYDEKSAGAAAYIGLGKEVIKRFELK